MIGAMAGTGLGLGRRLPMVMQAEAAECGLACLVMILDYHGHRVDLGTLRRRHAVSLKGATLRDLIQLAGELGVATRALRLEVKDLPRLRTPCILHWDLNHFVVLHRVGPTGIIIHDPARGRRVVPLTEASRLFTGVALEAAPSAAFVRRDERNQLRLRHLFRGLAGLGGALGQILALSLGIELIALLLPIGSQIIVDEVIVSADHDLLLVVGVGLGLLLAIQLAVATARGWAIMLTGTTVNYQWSAGLFEHLTRLPLDFFQKRHVGDIISRFTALSAIQRALTTDLVQAVLDGVMSLGMLAMLFFYGGWLGAVALATSALDAGLRIASQRGYRDASEEALMHEAQQQTHFIETVRGIATVKLLGLRDRRRTTWLNHVVDALNARLRLQRLDIVFGRADELLFGADRLLLMVLGARMVMANQMTLGMLVAFLAYKDQFAQRITNLIGGAFQLRMLGVQTERLGDIVLAEQEQESNFAAAPAVARAQAVAAAAVATHNLSLRYADNAPWVFQNISVAIPAGQCVAITGPSGCGKTSLLKILMGLQRATEGAVIVDGVYLMSGGLVGYRQRIAGVLQDDDLFAGSIAENICGFDSHCDVGWMEECAARAAIIDDIRAMPMGFETLVGDMGSALSGGQKQRVVLARALYRRPEILFLDEATSHLDEAREAHIAEALRGLRMTRVVVAHRPGTIAHADLVIPFGAMVAQQEGGARLRRVPAMPRG